MTFFSSVHTPKFNSDTNMTMPDHADFSKMTVEELLLTKKQVKKNQMLAAVLIGFFIGILIYGIVQKGFGLLSVAMLSVIYVLYRSSQTHNQTLKQIEAEFSRRNTDKGI